MSIGAELGQHFCVNTQLKKSEDSLVGFNPLTTPMGKPVVIMSFPPFNGFHCCCCYRTHNYDSLPPRYKQNFHVIGYTESLAVSLRHPSFAHKLSLNGPTIRSPKTARTCSCHGNDNERRPINDVHFSVARQRDVGRLRKRDAEQREQFWQPHRHL